MKILPQKEQLLAVGLLIGYVNIDIRENHSNGYSRDEMFGWHHPLNAHGFGGLQELVMDREA